MSPRLAIQNISDTSFLVAYFRAQETDRADAIFADPLAKKLVGERGEHMAHSISGMSKYVEWSVISRTIIIDRFIQKLVQSGSVDSVLNLGAGLDTRPYRLNLPSDLKWVEVDHPDIIRHKNEILKSEKPYCQLLRVELDLANRIERKKFFTDILNTSKSVLVLTEGVLFYLNEEQVAGLGEDLYLQSRFCFWIAEYLHPRVYPHLKTRTHKVKMRNSPFLFFPKNWFDFFKNLGWVELETRYTDEIAVEFSRTPPMPWYAKLIVPLLPQKTKEEISKSIGYVIFQRAKR